MGLLKNIHLLTEISEADKLKMEHAAVEHSRYSAITFKIIDVTAKAVTIQVAQGKSSAGHYFDKKRLIEIVHETYDRFFKGLKVLVQPIPYVESPVNKVDAAWINKKMLATGTRLKDIVDDTGLDKTNISSLLGGEKIISQPMKALFYYYFLAKERGAGIAY